MDMRDVAEEIGETGGDRFSAAALAFCRTVLGEQAAEPAASDAVAAFHQSIGERPPTDDDAELLLAVTRLMAAVSLPDRSTPSARRQVVLASVGAASHCSCREAGALLASRANGRIDERQSAALDEHLGDCAYCRALELQLGRAEESFREAVAVAPSGSLGGRFRASRLLAAALVLAILAAAGIVRAETGGGTSRPTQAVYARATKSAASTPASSPSTHRTARRHVAHRHPHRTHVRRAPVTAATPVAGSANTGTVGATGTTGASPASTTPAETPAATATPAQPTEPDTTPSAPTQTTAPTSSLPASSAPQKGIGTITSSGG